MKPAAPLPLPTAPLPFPKLAEALRADLQPGAVMTLPGYPEGTASKEWSFRFAALHGRPTTDLPLDVLLMIERPVRYVEQFCDAGADIVTCHVEADTEENILSAINKIHAKGKKAGVVVKPKTPASAVLPFIDKVELILVMTVEPGFGGQKFMADMMPKVQAIRGYIDAMNPACELEVDGGVDGDTCKLCIASGANVLVAGSAVYKAADIPAKIKELRG